jgi:hypothetical protein
LNLKCSGGPPVNLRPPLFRHRSRATRERRGRAAASHTVPPDRGAGPTPPTPRRCVAPPVAHPPLPAAPPFLFPQVLPREHAPEQYIAPPLFPRPRVHAGRLDCHHHAVFAPPHHRFTPNSVISVVPSLSASFGPCLTSLILSSSYRTHRRPPRPPELRRGLGTPPYQAVFSAPPPSAIFGENPTAPPCPAQPPSLPCGVHAGRARPRLPVKPHHRAAARVATAR